MKNLTINPDITIPHVHDLTKVDALAQMMLYANEDGKVLTLQAISEVVGSKDPTLRVSSHFGDLLSMFGIAEAVIDSTGNKTYDLTESGREFMKLSVSERIHIYNVSLKDLPLYEMVSNGISKTELIGYYQTSIKEVSQKDADNKVSPVVRWHKDLNNDDLKFYDISIDNLRSISRSISAMDKNCGKFVSYSKSDRTAKEEKVGELCTGCWTTKPLTNICDDCD